MIEDTGFVIERVSVTGEGLPAAEMSFDDGLNVVTGASNTGKSFIVELIDFLFGATSLERMIEEAKPYTNASLVVRARASGKRFLVERPLVGGDARVDELGRGDVVISSRVRGARHVGGDHSTLSSFWLELSGMDGANVRTNSAGDTRSLSFRDVAFLSVVEETRIISKDPPHEYSPRDRVVDGSVLRFISTGRDTPASRPASKAEKAEGTGRVQVIEQLLADVETELRATGLADADVDRELLTIEEDSSAAFSSLEEVRADVLKAERERQTILREVRTAQAQLGVAEGLLKRFELLDEHYQSDIERLLTIEEAADRLAGLEPEACPMCGAPASQHRAELIAEDDDAVSASTAAGTERRKVEVLRVELDATLSKLRGEVVERTALRDGLQQRADSAESALQHNLQPRLLASSADIRAYAEKKHALLRAKVIMVRRADLIQRREREKPAAIKKPRGRKLASPKPTTSDMDPFADEVQTVLKAWHFPGLQRVIFAEISRDLVINGQPRASQGKGVRAVTCAAFIVALMRHCVRANLAHTRFVALDSPMIAYKDPDPTDAALREAGLADAFYRSLAKDGAGQIIVVENLEPPADVAKIIRYYHFTKTTTGRHGFF